MLVGCLTCAAGIFAWTILEYVIHGVMGHANRTFVTPMHQVHHRDPRAVFALGAWIPTIAVLLGGLYLFGSSRGIIFFAGLVVGFACYEIIHYRIHFSTPLGRIETRLRARHLAHHFQKPSAIFGVTTSLWDHVMRSEPSPTEMRALIAYGEQIEPLDG